MTPRLSFKALSITVLGSAILAFGLYNVHSLSAVTEGGILGLTLLIDHWFGISPAVSGLILNCACYIFGQAVLGGSFLLLSFAAGGSFSLFYCIFEQFPPVYPQIASQPLLAALAGAVFVGVGVGLGVRMGAASGGDDALAMGISKLSGLRISTVYLISDMTVLLLSLSYIPLSRIAYSLLTVVLSGQIIGLIDGKKPQTRV